MGEEICQGDDFDQFDRIGRGIQGSRRMVMEPNRGHHRGRCTPRIGEPFSRHGMIRTQLAALGFQRIESLLTDQLQSAGITTGSDAIEGRFTDIVQQSRHISKGLKAALDFAGDAVGIAGDGKGMGPKGLHIKAVAAGPIKKCGRNPLKSQLNHPRQSQRDEALFQGGSFRAATFFRRSRVKLPHHGFVKLRDCSQLAPVNRPGIKRREDLARDVGQHG